METSEYRIIPRRRAVFFAVLLLLVLASVVWIATGWVEDYERYITELQAVSREEALSVLRNHVRIFALGQAAPIWVLACFLIWQSYRAIGTQSLPPLGSWIIEGQRIRSGTAAVRIAWLTIALAVLLVTASTGTAIVTWNLAESFQSVGTGDPS